MTGILLAVEVGALSGFLAARVLGQYEFPVTDPDAPARLLFVGPNLAAAARSLDADDRRSSAGSRCTRRRTRCSSPAFRGCGHTWRAGSRRS